MQSNLRRIYYDKFSGDKLIEVSFLGYIATTTVDQDIATFTALSERNRESFGVLELEYGQYAQDFAECNGYRVNPETKELEFSYPDPNEPEAPPVFQEPLTKQIEQLDKRQLETENAVLMLMDMNLL